MTPGRCYTGSVDEATKRLTVAVPLRVHEALRRLARRDRRSLTVYVALLLERHVGGEGDAEPRAPSD